MLIDMRGFKVVYGNQAYACLTIDFIPDVDLDGNTHMGHPIRLRVTVIDHDARISVIEDYESRFAFLKDNSDE